MIRIETDPFRVDWFQVLEDLRRAGIPVASVAAQIRVPKATVMGWKNTGAEPKYADGERLVDLWIGIMLKNRHYLPRVGDRPEMSDLAGSGGSSV
jgi:hypothetical protein